MRLTREELWERSSVLRPRLDIPWFAATAKREQVSAARARCLFPIGLAGSGAVQKPHSLGC